MVQGLRSFLKKRLISFRGNTKVFCIGMNKTGTTTLAKLLKEFGYRMGHQHEAEKLIQHYAKRDFRPILDFCKKAEAFQDIPFSLPYTYVVMDQYFPGSKFILSVRNDAEEWYNSLIKYHSKKMGKGSKPTKEELKQHGYVYKGWVWEANRIVYNTPEDDPFEEETLKQFYRQHNEWVKDYFQYKDNLLVLNLGEENSYQKLCSFLKVNPIHESLPWENKTTDIK